MNRVKTIFLVIWVCNPRITRNENLISFLKITMNDFSTIHQWLSTTMNVLFICSGVNFINILPPAFTSADPESVKIQLSHQYIFRLLWSTRVKAARRTLMKLTPGAFKLKISAAKIDNAQFCKTFRH